MPPPITLTFKREAVRVLIEPSGIWLPAADLFALFERRTNRRALSRFSPDHLALKAFDGPAGPHRLTSVSPLGAVTIAKLAAPPVDRMLDGWARRNLNEIAEQHGLAPLSLTLLADNTMPVKPPAYYDSFDTWGALRLENFDARQNPPDPHAPALFDDDPVLGPYHPASAISPTLEDLSRTVPTAIDYAVNPDRAVEAAALLARMGIHRPQLNTQP
ncbi:hypothetical protein ACMGDM_10285 [Sphingomonas sp. DT-51]|uniref:hypothetical protein n=1 Tax=Sphingomonas sp. DT-51 TaxID=3396165 RepID=UPI003F1C4F09